MKHHGSTARAAIQLGPIAALCLSACSGAADLPELLTSEHPAPIEQKHFGLFIHRLDDGTAWPGVRFGSWRLWDAGVMWADLERTHGRWSFRRLDSYVAQAAAHDVEVLLH
jgi:hypothetical protein